MMTFFTYFSLLISLTLFTGCQSEDKKHEQKAAALPVTEVTAMTVIPQKGHLQTEIVGTVKPANKAVIAAKVSGTIEKVSVVLGSTVKAGDTLVKISAGEISAKAVQAQAQMAQVRRNLEREKKLLQKNAATAENVKSLEEMYMVAEAVHREAVTMLGYTTITAPFDGVITKKVSNTGDLAIPGTPLLHMENISKLQIEASVPEALLLNVQSGNTVTVHIPVARLAVQGLISEVAPAADPLSRTATIKIDIDPQPQLRSGQFARVLLPGERKESLIAPSTAIRTFGQMEQMFVIDDNKARLRLVRTGAVMGDQTEILAGLEPGEMIVVSNISKLMDGQPVTIVK